MSNGAKSSSSAPTIIALLLGVSVAIFINPTWTKLLELGQYGWFFLFGIVIPVVVALVFYLLSRALGRYWYLVLVIVVPVVGVLLYYLLVG